MAASGTNAPRGRRRRQIWNQRAEGRNGEGRRWNRRAEHPDGG
ncbi:MAG: hypothetical protein RXR06_01320 [Thermoproteus sp.]